MKKRVSQKLPGNTYLGITKEGALLRHPLYQELIYYLHQKFGPPVSHHNRVLIRSSPPSFDTASS